MKEHEQDIAFRVTEPASPPAYLFGRILKHIGIERKIAASKRRTAYFSFALAISIIACTAALFALQGALIESEFAKLISVIASDPLTAAANWQDFGWFLLESFPVAYVALFLVSLFALLESLRYLARYMNATFSFSKFVKAK